MNSYAGLVNVFVCVFTSLACCVGMAFVRVNCTLQTLYPGKELMLLHSKLNSMERKILGLCQGDLVTHRGAELLQILVCIADGIQEEGREAATVKALGHWYARADLSLAQPTMGHQFSS